MGRISFVACAVALGSASCGPRSAAAPDGPATPVAAPSVPSLEFRILGGEPPGMQHRLGIEPDGRAHLTRNGYIDEVGEYEVQLPADVAAGFREAVEDARSDAPGGPFVPDTVVAAYRLGDLNVSYREGEEPSGLRAARDAALAVLLAAPLWTVAFTAVCPPSDGSGARRLVVTLRNRGVRTVRLDHPAAAKADGTTPLVTDMFSSAEWGVPSEYRWRPARLVDDGTAPAELVLEPGGAAELVVELVLPTGEQPNLHAAVIYEGEVRPDGSEPLRGHAVSEQVPVPP